MIESFDNSLVFFEDDFVLYFIQGPFVIGEDVYLYLSWEVDQVERKTQEELILQTGSLIVNDLVIFGFGELKQMIFVGESYLVVGEGKGNLQTLDS